MRNSSSCQIKLVWFRRPLFVWIVFGSIFFSLLPSVSFAQQPTATISSVHGTILVNGQEQDIGTVLSAHDVIETLAGSSVILELSDGSSLELGENTKIDLTEFTQADTGARVSWVKLLWGQIRAKLSPEHQQAGSSFDIETPNALIGVKFSQPDVEVSYNPSNQETIGLAHTVELMAKNLLTDEEMLVPVGSTVIVAGTTIKIVAGILAIADATTPETTATTAAARESAGGDSIGTTASETGTSETVSSGMGIGTKVAIGIGAAAAVGGGVAVAAISSAESDSGNDVSFTGTFAMESFGSAGYMYGAYNLEQNGATVTGTFELIDDFWGTCTVSYTVPLAGTVDEQGNFLFSWPLTEECCSCGGATCCARIVGGNYTAVLTNDGNALTVSGPACTLQGLVCWGLGFFSRQ